MMLLGAATAVPYEAVASGTTASSCGRGTASAVGTTTAAARMTVVPKGATGGL